VNDLNPTTVPNEEAIRGLLSDLITRKSETKFRVLKTLSAMDERWHSLKEISESAAKIGVGTAHLFENLVELTRTSNLIESDYVEKRFPRLTNFRIFPHSVSLLRRIMRDYESRDF